MAPDATLPDFGRMTVPPLFGWQILLTGVVVVLLVGMVAFALMATGRADSSRSEWEAWLAARSTGRPDLGDELAELPSSGPDSAMPRSRATVRDE
jgi:hypothetical protein